MVRKGQKRCTYFWAHCPTVYLCPVQELGKSWRWVWEQKPALTGEPSMVKGFVEQTEPKTCWAADMKQVAV